MNPYNEQRPDQKELEDVVQQLQAFEPKMDEQFSHALRTQLLSSHAPSTSFSFFDWVRAAFPTLHKPLLISIPVVLGVFIVPLLLQQTQDPYSPRTFLEKAAAAYQAQLAAGSGKILYAKTIVRDGKDRQAFRDYSIKQIQKDGMLPEVIERYRRGNALLINGYAFEIWSKTDHTADLMMWKNLDGAVRDVSLYLGTGSGAGKEYAYSAIQKKPLMPEQKVLVACFEFYNPPSEEEMRQHSQTEQSWNDQDSTDLTMDARDSLSGWDATGPTSPDVRKNAVDDLLQHGQVQFVRSYQESGKNIVVYHAKGRNLPFTAPLPTPPSQQESIDNFFTNTSYSVEFHFDAETYDLLKEIITLNLGNKPYEWQIAEFDYKFINDEPKDIFDASKHNLALVDPETKYRSETPWNDQFSSRVERGEVPAGTREHPRCYNQKGEEIILDPMTMTEQQKKETLFYKLSRPSEVLPK